MVKFIRSDLQFILDQILIAERQAAGEALIDILPNVQVPFGLRTVTGALNNLVVNQSEFGAADSVFPRLTVPVFRTAEAAPPGFGPPGAPPTSYQQTSGLVFDSQPRTISNLIVDMTANNPAAVAAAAANPGSQVVDSPGLDGQFGTADDKPVFFIPNVTPDVGLSAPFNTWMTFFGQFFDHGLDLVTKGGSGTVFIPLQPDDPLFVPGSPTNFMVLSRATNLPGPDGILGNADDIHEASNTTSPFVDQNQTYSSHPSHQVFLRAYEFNGAGDPVATGKLITNRDLGDGVFGNGDDVQIGGMATWAVVKAQARDILGIHLTDADFNNVPLLATDAYGNFIKGPNGFPMVMMKGADGIADTADDFLVEGNPAAPIDLTNAVRTGHQFLIDIAHAAVPVFVGGVLAPDSDNVVGLSEPGTYDNELLDAHYIAGDGRVNENIGLTTVHSIFHSEHNRLVEHTKDVALSDAAQLLAGGASQAAAVAFLNQWLLVDVTSVPTTPAAIAALQWDGERLFQAAKFGTEMQYQHLVFEEFARTIQPQVDEFLAPAGYNTTIDPSIVAEFAHTVFRFGHSMLVETIDRFDPSFNVVGDGNPTLAGNQQTGLIAAFLNPLAFAASGPTPEQAAGAIVRGLTRQVGNEIDEFVTEAVRNNLVGLPLDLPALNIARGRDTGIPTLNAARREFYAMTGDSQLKPYISWVDLVSNLKHPESLVNFIAAYGTHSSITSATTLVDKRAAATLLVLGGAGEPLDRIDFLNSTGAYANNPTTGATITGVDAIDFWIGGLAEQQMPFGGLLGSTFNFVFETQLESLQNGDRFYYLSRTAGLNFGTELENNSFSALVMLNSDATHLPSAIFSTPTFILEVDPTKQFTGLGADGRADPTGGIFINGIEITPLVIRDNPDTAGADTNYLQYTGEDHVVLGGTAGNDILIAGDGDDTIYGDAGNDRIEGGYGNDEVHGGAGDDIIQDLGGDDTIHGDAGNDVIQAGNMVVGGVGNLILGGDGQDFIITTEDISTTFGGTGNDFILGAKTNLPPTGNEGDDWIEFGTQDGAPGDNFAPLAADEVVGNDIFIGGGGFDEFIGEGGDDIFTGSDAQDKMDGNSGFDWVTYKNDRFGVTVDMALPLLSPAHGENPLANPGVFQPVGASPASIADRFAEVEGLSGTRFGDILKGDNATAALIAGVTATGNALTNVALIGGLQELLGPSATGFATGNIILGGDGSDIIEGRGGDDLIDGDKWLNVRISVRSGFDASGPIGGEIASFDSMVDMIPLMLNGTYNPGQLQAVREIKAGAGGFDTAVFSGNFADYTISINNNGTPLNFSDDIVTVTDSVVGRDGADRLTHIERLQFADQSSTLVPGLNSDPVGLLTINDANGGTLQVGDTLTVSIAGVTDADNPGTGAITQSTSYFWQVERVPGSGVFEDIILPLAGRLGFQSADGTTLRVTPDLAGLSLRVKGIYQDAHSVTELVFSAPTTPVVAAPVAPPVAPVPVVDAVAGGAGIHLVRSDLNFILDQIKIAEANAAGADLLSLLPNVRAAFGLRTVDGSFNNLVRLSGIDQSEFGAADNVFPRLTDPVFRTAEAAPPGFGPPGAPPTSYQQTSGLVFDSQPRTISNLIVDMTANNPAAVAAAADNPGSSTVVSPGLDGIFGTTDDRDVFFIPNVTPDAGLSAPFNAWMTFFGQFFDHGLDLVTKGGSGTVFIPLNADDPLVAGADGIFGNADDLSPSLRFMVVTRATNLPGPDGILGNADDIHEHTNTTSPFVDQNQTYSSHPSHQVFLRAYEFNGAGDPVATGKLITNRDLGDGVFGNGDDVEIGGMATWKVVKAQARDILGINLTDADFNNVPLLATDAYGNFIKGANGFPQVVIRTGNGLDGIAGNADDTTTLVEGNPLAPVDLTNAVRTGHAFLNDIAHAAVPVFVGGVLAPDSDSAVGLSQPGTYDNELLDAHYIAGDGRVNENIGLTTVHAIFHSEHNRLVQQTKDTVLASNDLTFLTEWLAPGTAPATFPVLQADIDALQWNGERLFQTAKFGTEMQYQHLVFEEFARTIQPNVDLFFAPTQVYDADLDASIVAEFAHAVYRFGHSMLTETIDRLDPNFQSSEIGLIAAFLNPLAFAASGPTPEQAAGAIIRGLTRQVGNEIDEFVTEALRNNLVGLPLDLPAINMARARDTGVPSLNAVRRDIYAQTGDSNLKPYTSWADLVQHLKHPESLINFIAAYGTHASITSATTLVDKRAAATLLVLGGPAEPLDRFDFLNSTGAYASLANGVTTTGVDAIDLWVGGLAEEKMPFGGMLGSTFNFVFENQLEKLQDGDRFYYLERTAGLAFNAELEGNSFAKLIMANTDATHLPALVFSTPTYILEVDPTKQHTGLNDAGPDGIQFDDPLTAVDESADNVVGPDGIAGNSDPTGGILLTPLVIRDNPDTVGPDTNYLRYTGEDHIVLGGTAGNDILISSIGDDTVWGDAGDDRIDAGYGNDQVRGGAGNDIITDKGGDDNIQGGDGDDVIQGGNGINLIIGGFGQDFIITGEDASEAFGGQGNDFILGSTANEQDIGNEGDDWIEGGTSDGAPGDNFDPLGNDPIIGNDVFIGRGENDKFNAEGGDDIMVGSVGLGDRYIGGSGYDWATFKDDQLGVYIDISKLRFFDQPPVPGSGASVLTRFDIVEGLSGSSHADFLTGGNETSATLPTLGAQGSVLTNIALIDGLQQFLDLGRATPATFFDGGNIILGGDGSDIIKGLGGDDLIDGDKWLNVRISVRTGHDPVTGLPTGGEIYTADSMTDALLMHNMLNGVWNPGQLQIVREILNGTGGFDTAVFQGNLADYDIAINDGGTPLDFSDDIITVTDSVAARDGSDRLTHIERLQFADVTMVVADGNSEPVGSPTVFDALTGTPDDTPRVGQLLRVSVNDLFPVTDADNPGDGSITGPVSYFWQVDRGKGFEDITAFAAGEVSRVGGPTLLVTSDLNGLSLRVRAIYKDGHGVLEQLYSNPTALVSVDGAPVITSDGGLATAALSVLENSTAVTTVTATDPDAGDTVSFSIVGGADAALFAIDATTGVLTFNSAPNFEVPTDAGPNNVYNVTVQASDGILTDTQAIAVTVTNVNEAPVASPVTLAAIAEDSGARLITSAQLLAGVTDVDGPAATITSLSIATGLGSLVDNLNGTWTYTPALNDDTSVTFNYTASDGEFSASSTASLDITPVNDAPVASPVTLTAIAEDSGARLITSAQLLAGVTDVDGPPATITSLSIATGLGSLVDNLNGTWTYTPALNDDTSVTFNYTASDGEFSASSTASLDITPVNDAPVASPVTLTAIAEDSGARLITSAELLAGVTDVDGPAATITSLSIATGLGSLVDNLNGSWTYTPALNDDTSVTFNYAASDGSLSSSSTASLDITPVNDAPVAAPVILASIAEDSGARLITSAELLAGVTDVDGPPATITSLSIATGLGSLVDNLNGSWTYTPALNDTTSVSFNYTTSDGEFSSSSTAALDITPVNDPPVGAPTATLAAGVEDTAYVVNSVDLLQGFSDADGDPLSVANLSTPNGSVVDIGGGLFRVDLALNFNGLLTLTYDVIDGQGGVLAAQSLTANIQSVNDAPVALDAVTGSTLEDTDFVFSVAQFGFSDPNDIPADSLAGVVVSSLPAAGVLRNNGVAVNAGDFVTVAAILAGQMTFAPAPNANGVGYASFTFQVRDNGGTLLGGVDTDPTPSTFTIDVTPVNDAPTAPANNSVTTLEDTASLAVAIGASDVDSAALTYSVLSGTDPVLGAVTFDNAAGTFDYTPNLNANGADTFTILIDDGNGGTTQQVVTVGITPVNDAPVAADDAFTTDEDIAVSGNVLIGDSDVDNATLTAVLGTGPANGTLVLNANGTFTYTPNANFNGSDSFTYLASDGTLTSNLATVSLTVNPINDAPVITSNGAGATATITRPENTTAVTTVTATDVDTGTNLVYSLVSVADFALFAIDVATGALSFLAPPDFEAPAHPGNAYNVTVQVSDGIVTDTQAITVNVSNVSGLIIGTNGNNTLVGTSEEDTISGLAGNDRLVGLTGNDTINGGADDDRFIASLNDGDDTYIGGGGADTYVLSGTSADATVDLVANTASSAQTGTDSVAGIENVTGSQGDDIIGGDAGVNVLNGVSGNDILNGFDGADVLNGGSGRDTLNGGLGADTLFGSTGDDTLNGGAGDDTLFGGNGADRVNGGSGNDAINVVDGNDTIVVAPGFGNDRIINFDAIAGGGQDLIELNGMGITNANFAVRVTIIDDGADTVVSINDDGNAATPNHTLRLVGVGNVNNVSIADFLFS